MTTLRRALTVPAVVMIEVLLLITAPLLLLVAALASAGRRSTRPLRSAALVLAYATIELSTLNRLRRGADDPNVLLREVLMKAYRTTRRILDVRVALESGSATRQKLATSKGLVILARHCGPGDSLFIAWLLVVHYQLRLRVVLKAVLRLEPTLDLAGDHLPLCFIGPNRRRARSRIHALAASMSPGDALLLFPEGGNFSRPRWLHTVAELTDRTAYDKARRARGRTYTLPPHLGGVLAALTGAPTADVLLLAHSGFARDGRDRPGWRLPVHRTLVIHTALAPSSSVPREPAALSTWLDTAWSEVDTWVHRHVEHQGRTDGPATSGESTIIGYAQGEDHAHARRWSPCGTAFPSR
ncbi:MAG: 1-acyl-sn-glycerol-3-phosphate acyltransferase [Pseudonocardiaceae bacterium]